MSVARDITQRQVRYAYNLAAAYVSRHDSKYHDLVSGALYWLVQYAHTRAHNVTLMKWGINDALKKVRPPTDEYEERTMSGSNPDPSVRLDAKTLLAQLPALEQHFVTRAVAFGALEMAEHTGVSHQAVSKRLNKKLKHLREFAK